MRPKHHSIFHSSNMTEVLWKKHKEERQVPQILLCSTLVMYFLMAPEMVACCAVVSQFRPEDWYVHLRF